MAKDKRNCNEVLAAVREVMLRHEFDSQFVDDFLKNADNDTLMASFKKNIEGLKSKQLQTKINAIYLNKNIKAMDTDAVRYAEYYKNHWFGKKNRTEDHVLTKVWVDMISGGAIREVAQKRGLEGHIGSVVQFYQSKLAGKLTRFRPRLNGLARDKKAHPLIVRALYGQEVNDKEVMNLAQALHKTWEEQRLHMNRLGAKIDEKEFWNLPQHHDGGRISKAGYDKWKADILDPQRGIDTKYLAFDKDGNAMGHKLSEKQINQLLKSIYENITTAGFKKVKVPTDMPKGYVPLHSRTARHRYLNFSTPEAWLAYSEKYGAPDVFNSLMGHTNNMSKEIAAMERFGPQHPLVVRQIQNYVEQKAGRGKGIMAYQAYNQLMGRGMMGNVDFADLMTNMRALSTAPKIGGAVINAISDTAYHMMTNVWRGQPIFSGMGRKLKNLNPTDFKDREFAAHLMVGSHYAISQSRDNFRYTEALGHGKPSQFAETMVRGSGLNHWTMTGRDIHNLDFLNYLATAAKTSRNAKLKKVMKQYGITDEQWARARKAITSRDGADYLDPNQMEYEDAMSIVGMVTEESRMAVPDANAKTRAFMYGDSKSGETGGELRRSIMHFKTFPISVMFGPLSRAFHASPRTAMGMATGMFVSATSFGFLAYQAKEFLNGRQINFEDDIADPEVWAKAAFIGGSGGAIGDILFNDPGSRPFVSEFLLGPSLSDAQTILQLPIGLAYDVLTGEKEIGKRAGQNAAKIWRSAWPNFWPTKLLVDRGIKDFGTRVLNPEYNQHLQALRTKERNKGGDIWWESGKAPEFDKIFK